MRYPPEIVDPCREDLVEAGITELHTPADVDQAIKGVPGTTLVVINSVCGCAAGVARPAVKLALKHTKLPEKLTTVFAGVDIEATERVRSHLDGYPPSSPGVVLFKNGDPVCVLERHHIEGRTAEEIAFDLVTAFDEHC